MLSLFQDDTENQTSEKKEGTKKKKHRVKTVELPIEAYTHGYSQTELNNYMELEVSKIQLFVACVLVVSEGYHSSVHVNRMAM
jgi:TATA-binding protein-associated factor Taf7